MNRKYFTIVTSIAFLVVTLACQLTSATVTPTEIPVEDTVQVVEEPAEPTEDFSAATQAAEEAAQAAEESAQATEEAAALEIEQATQESIILTATAEVAIIETEAAQVDTEATAQVQGMYDAVQQLASEGLLEKTEGTYTQIEDFNETWAQIGWYQWWSTGLAPTDFVIRAHTEWESASRTANWFDSGCGFVFREEDADNHYMVFLALDGNVYLKGYVDGKYKEFGKGYLGKVDFMKGGADVMLAVEGDHILYFVNGKKVLERNVSELSEGNLALTLVSGTNKDYGTRCSVTDIEVWSLDQ